MKGNTTVIIPGWQEYARTIQYWANSDPHAHRNPSCLPWPPKIPDMQTYTHSVYIYIYIYLQIRSQHGHNSIREVGSLLIF